MTSNIFDYTRPLQRTIDPVLAKVSEEYSLATDPLLGQLDAMTIDGFQTENAGKLNIYEVVSDPQVYFGDRYSFKTATDYVETGTVKFRKYTQAYSISLDAFERMQQLGDASLVKQQAARTFRDNTLYLRDILSDHITNEQDTDSIRYDPDIKALFGLSSTGTVDDPRSIESTPGTIENATTQVILTGTNETDYPLGYLGQKILDAFGLTDPITKRTMEINNLTMGVNKALYNILKTRKQAIGDNRRSEQTILQEINAMGINVIVNENLCDYTYGDGEDAEVPVIGNLNSDWLLMAVTPPGGANKWGPWREKEVEDLTGSYTLRYTRERRYELGWRPKPYTFRDDSGGRYWYKPVFHIKFMPYEQA